MGRFCSLLLALVLLCSASNDFVQSTMFTVVNMCNYTVWPGVRTDKETFSSTGFTLAAGESRTLRAPVGWKGRFWGRTGCKFDDKGRGNCSTGDCGSDQIECNGAGSTPPATLAEFKLNGPNGEDFYDVSLVDGYAKKIFIYLFCVIFLSLFIDSWKVCCFTCLYVVELGIFNLVKIFRSINPLIVSSSPHTCFRSMNYLLNRIPSILRVIASKLRDLCWHVRQ